LVGSLRLTDENASRVIRLLGVYASIWTSDPEVLRRTVQFQRRLYQIEIYVHKECQTHSHTFGMKSAVSMNSTAFDFKLGHRWTVAVEHCR